MSTPLTPISRIYDIDYSIHSSYVTVQTTNIDVGGRC